MLRDRRYGALPLESEILQSAKNYPPVAFGMEHIGHIPWEQCIG